MPSPVRPNIPEPNKPKELNKRGLMNLKRPLEHVNKQISDILTEDYNYLMSEGITPESNNQTMNETLAVFQFIHGDDTMPKVNASMQKKNQENTRSNISGGKRRKSRKNRR